MRRDKVVPVDNDSDVLYDEIFAAAHKRLALRRRRQIEQNLSPTERLKRAKKQRLSLKDTKGLAYSYLLLCNFANDVVSSTLFTNYMLLCVVIAVIQVGIVTYPVAVMSAPMLLYTVDTVILYSFVSEIILKVLSEGRAPWAFFIGDQWQWNLLDFVIVALCLPVIPFSAGQVKILRLVRLLRLIKIFQKFPEMNLIIMGVVGSVRSVFYIIVLFFLTLYMFAVLGTIILSSNDPWHFANIEMSIMTMLRTATFDSWGDVLYTNYYGCDVYSGGIYSNDPTLTEMTSGSIYCANPQAQPVFSFIYFVSVSVIAVFCILALFIGAVSQGVTDNIFELEAQKISVRVSQQKERMEQVARSYGNRDSMNRKMKRRAELIEMVFLGHDLNEWEMKYDDPRSFREFYQRHLSFPCQDLIDNPLFHHIVTAVILLAAVLAGVETDASLDARYASTFDACNILIQSVFLFEIAVKLIAEEHAPWRYFYDGWNVFDVLVVSASFIPTSIGGTSTIVTFLRLLRLLRVLKLTHQIPELQILVSAVFRCISSIGFICLILVIFFYFFAVIAVTVFSENDPADYGSLHLAMLTLFDAATLDNWTVIVYVEMFGCAVYPGNWPKVCPNPQPNYVFTLIFYWIFIILGALVLLALFISVVSTSLEETTADIEGQKKVEHTAKQIAAAANVDANTFALYKEVFSVVDFTNSRRVGRVEMRFGLLVAGVNLEDDDFQRFWQLLDRDGSGSLDLSEFLQFILDMKSQLREFKLTHTVDGVDVNGPDGPAPEGLSSAAAKYHDGKTLTAAQKFEMLKSFRASNKYIVPLDRDDGDDDHFDAPSNSPVIFLRDLRGRQSTMTSKHSILNDNSMVNIRQESKRDLLRPDTTRSRQSDVESSVSTLYHDGSKALSLQISIDTQISQSTKVLPTPLTVTNHDHQVAGISTKMFPQSPSINQQHDQNTMTPHEQSHPASHTPHGRLAPLPISMNSQFVDDSPTNAPIQFPLLSSGILSDGVPGAGAGAGAGAMGNPWALFMPNNLSPDDSLKAGRSFLIEQMAPLASHTSGQFPQFQRSGSVPRSGGTPLSTRASGTTFVFPELSPAMLNAAPLTPLRASGKQVQIFVERTGPGSPSSSKKLKGHKSSDDDEAEKPLFKLKMKKSDLAKRNVEIMSV